MHKPKEKALEITADLVKTRLETAKIAIDKEGGEQVAEFFQAIYNKVAEIAESIGEEN